MYVLTKLHGRNLVRRLCTNKHILQHRLRPSFDASQYLSCAKTTFSPLLGTLHVKLSFVRFSNTAMLDGIALAVHLEVLKAHDMIKLAGVVAP